MAAPATHSYDVIVCGAGMSGLCTAVTALEAGARVVVIEKGERPGGSMRMSGGTLWTARSMADMEAYVPGGDRARQRQLVEGIGPGITWLEGLEAPLDGVIAGEHSTGREFEPNAFTEHMVGVLQRAGGEIRMATALDAIDIGSDGRVAGVRVREDSGRRSSVAGSAVVLATGGFQGNHELMARWIGRFADRMLRRANPNSAGEGLLAALAAGARTSPNLSTFYGHTMPAPPADPPPGRWTAVTAYYSQDAVLVNERGERFFDESRSLSDETAPIEIVQQPNGRAFLVMDRRIHDDVPLPGRSQAAVGPNFKNAAEAGGHSAIADSLPALADAMAPWGVSKAGFLATIAEFNEAVEAGRGAELRVARTKSPFGLIEPPFYALAVRAGITFTLGGADADTEMRVLDRAGKPIPGLYAAGADAGGTYQGGYMGGLVLGLVQGRVAGDRSAAYARAGAGGRRPPSDAARRRPVAGAPPARSA